jgi:cytochrome c peroxidase
MRAAALFAIALVACSKDASCPEREEGDIGVLGSVPRGLTFDGIDGPVQLDAYHSPCQPKLLLVRTTGAWCGTCLWHAGHTRQILAPFGDRVRLVDLVVSDEDNAPPTRDALVRFATRIDAPVPTVASDPRFTFAPARLSRAPLPAYAIIDARTMRILASMSNPDPVSLSGRLRIELASMDGAPLPPMPAPPLVDDRFTEDQIDLVREMRLVRTPPPDPTNAVADDPRAASLGRALFEDVDLSPARVACVKCHDPGQEFTDGLARSRGVAEVDRNSPPIALAAHSRWQFWDGRADTLWSQALGPIEDPREMGSSRAFVAQRVASAHRAAYESVFGPLPDVVVWPSSGKPGDPAYDALPDRTKDDITRVLVGVGKAIAAFERSLRVSENALDRYAGGDLGALTAVEKDGLLSFLRQGCAQCHFGPRLTNDAFHVVRFASGRIDGAPDLGRGAGLNGLRIAEFGASTRWSDARRSLALPAEGTAGAFKTPTLRGLPGTAPYGHGGTLATLADVAKHYGERGLPDADPRAIGSTEEWIPLFDVEAQRAMVPFLEILTARVENP